MKTKQILNFMKVMSWIIFIGLCIKLGAIIISFFVSLFINEEASKNIYLGLDLSEIYNYGKWQYVGVLSFLISLTMIKADIFYIVTKIFLKINLEKPFSSAVSKLLIKISYLCLSIGLIAIIGNRYLKWLTNKGLDFELKFEGTEFIFMAGVLITIAYVFKRGIEIQSENELTI